MRRRAESLVDANLEVLIERLDVSQGIWSARSQREAPEVDGEIRVTATRPVSVGDYVLARIDGSDGADLIGTTLT